MGELDTMFEEVKSETAEVKEEVVAKVEEVINEAKVEEVSLEETVEDKAARLHKEVEYLIADRNISDIPLNDEYYKKVSELRSFLDSLKA